MSRSIHHKKGWGIWQKLDGGSDSHLEAALKKTRIKRLVRLERSHIGSFNPIPVRSEEIVYEIEECDPQVFYPATIEDIKGVLSELSPGYLNGVSCIKLSLGKKYINSVQTSVAYEYDPISGRKCVQEWPGVYTPIVMGTYNKRSGVIQLFSYSLDNKYSLTSLDEMCLKIQMLETLLHEVAHNYDQNNRTARGRWRMDQEAKDERYATRQARKLVRLVVVPYLKRVYGKS